MSEEFKKKLEECENHKTELESQIEELKRSPPESTEQQSAMTDLQAQLDKMKGVSVSLCVCVCFQLYGNILAIIIIFYW